MEGVTFFSPNEVLQALCIAFCIDIALCNILRLCTYNSAWYIYIYIYVKYIEKKYSYIILVHSCMNAKVEKNTGGYPLFFGLITTYVQLVINFNQREFLFF